MDTVAIRKARASDAESLLEIYRPIVEKTAMSFELTPPTVAELAERIRTVQETHVWLLAAHQGETVGFAYATPHRAREAYRYSVETSVYVADDLRGKGLGLLLYRRLFSELERMSYYNAYAGVTLPNEASVKLHKSCGFRSVGVFRSVGYKFGKWHDVAWWHRVLRSGRPEPDCS